MSLLDLVILAVALLLVRFLAAPLLVTLIVALVTMILLRIAKGERIP